MPSNHRIDSASKFVGVSPTAVYHAFSEPGAMEKWLPPAGMVGRMLTFDFREGGSYRMRLTYLEPTLQGKTSDDSDEVNVRLVRLDENKTIEQAVTFESDDPAFSGTMKIIWVFEPAVNGTLVTVRCENVPEGIRQEDHETGLHSTLDNLASFLEG